MKQYFCNPLNFNYRYQFNEDPRGWSLNREAADPSMILFHGAYYLFPSMTDGFLVSTDLVNWERIPFRGLPAYDYAPDVRVIGDYMYFCASRKGEICDFYRTGDPESGEFERIPGTFDFWDPDMFLDDDGRLYFYWGCSNVTPIWGVELDRETMHRIGEPKVLIENHFHEFGYERSGENHDDDPKHNKIVHMIKANMAEQAGCRPEDITDITPAIQALPETYRTMVKAMVEGAPYIEGAWMTKHDGRYYLQYACPGAEYNVYADGVYVGDSPLGPFTAMEGNPFSYAPGGFFPGAGHGSTMEDVNGNLWHTSTMRISVNHNFERRVGIWPAGFDADGEMFCNQRYGDWPQPVSGEKQDPWAEPEWMLLSFGKEVSASSEAKPAVNAVDENVRTWWRAAEEDTAPWITVDLGKPMTVNAVQINLADDFGWVKLPEGAVPQGNEGRRRYIEKRDFRTQWLLEGSADGENWFVIEDRRDAETDLTHELVVREDGISARFVKLTVTKVAYDGPVCVSGLRVFGHADGTVPVQAAEVSAVRSGNRMGAMVSWKGEAEGFNVLWGHRPDKLYHSFMVFGVNELEIRALMANVKDYYVRVDAFNENGITHGEIVKVS